MRRQRRHVPAIASPREAAIQAAVLQHWQTFGVPGSLVFAIPNAKAHGQAGLTKGVFDLGVISPALGRVTGYIELKAQHGRLSTEQKDFRDLLAERGVPHVICYGRDEPILALEAMGAVRRQVREQPQAGALQQLEMFP
jgi:hypothetical protein